MNKRLMFLFDAEEKYKKMVNEINNYYIQSIVTNDDEKEIINNKKLYQNFKDYIEEVEYKKNNVIGIKSKLIILTEINSKLKEELDLLCINETKEKKIY